MGHSALTEHGHAVVSPYPLVRANMVAVLCKTSKNVRADISFVHTAAHTGLPAASVCDFKGVMSVVTVTDCFLEMVICYIWQIKTK